MNDFRQRRILAGISQSELAATVGCNQTTIGRIEKGGRTTPAVEKAIDAALPKLGEERIKNAGSICEPSVPYTVPDSQKPLDSAAVLGDRLRLLEEIVASQRQTISAQAVTIETLVKRIELLSKGPL
jgi:DNA-binding XRE family transcriptional regulator